MVDFRRGDIVTVKCEVKYLHGNHVSLRTVDGYGDFIIDSDKIEMHTPLFHAGERVSREHRGITTTGTVLAVHEGALWVREDSGAFDTWDAMFAKLAEDDPDQAPLPMVEAAPLEMPEPLAAEAPDEEEVVF